MIQRILVLFLVLIGLCSEVAYYSFKLGKWAARYEDSMKHLSECQPCHE